MSAGRNRGGESAVWHRERCRQARKRSSVWSFSLEEELVGWHQILDNYLDLLQQKKAFAELATVMPDGSPQVTPVWFDYSGGKIRVNTARAASRRAT